MVGASALSGICSLRLPSLPNYRERDKKNSGLREHVAIIRISTHAYIPDAMTSELKRLEQPISSEVKILNQRCLSSAADGHCNDRICGCGMESSLSRCASTSGRSGQVALAMNADTSSTSRRLDTSYPKRCSLEDNRIKSSSCVSSSCTTPCRLHNFLEHGERVIKEWWLQRQLDPSEISGVDLDANGKPGMNWQKQRAALAALAVAGYVSLSFSPSACAEVLRVDFPAPMTSFEALEAQFKGSIRKELESEIQIQRKEWGITSCSTSPSSPLQSPEAQINEAIPTPEGGSVLYEVVQELEEDGFQAWKQVQREIELEGEKSAVPVTRPVYKSTAKKVVAASVAVAVAGSVAGAASAAGRVVASSGSVAVATSLTALQHSAGTFPGSSLLARAAQHLGGGGVAGAVGATVVYPLDTIKTRMQAQSMEGEQPQYKDEIDCFKQIVAEEGPGSLYSGLVPQLLGIAPEKAMKLTVNDILLNILETMMPGARVWALEFIAGGGGGASQVVFTNPMEIVKVRLQTQHKEGPSKSMWEVVKELGVGGLYEGAGVTLARDVPSSAIFFACYTLLRQLYPHQSFLAGCVAAMPATILVTPMDIIKTRLQKEPTPGVQQHTDWWQCLQDIVQKEGPQALFKGSLLRVLRTSPQFGITLMLYGILCGGS